MMPGLISAGTTAQLRRTFDSLLAHTYTRTPSVADDDETYGPNDDNGTPSTGQKCRYRATVRLRLEDGNRVTVDTPTLTVPHDDPIKSGDQVSDVRDSDGVLLLTGPLRVETVEPSAGLGPTLQKRAILRGGDVR
jgi:hypothetical protein